MNPGEHASGAGSVRKQHLLLAGTLASISAALIAYAVTRAFAFDEGFHLLTAQLIAQGKRPYLDFIFPQTPLNAYWNAAWILLFGAKWRVTHVVAAVATAGAVALVTDYVYRRLADPSWRTQAALFTACAVGLNVAVVEYGTVAQPYGLCLFLIVAAWRSALFSVERQSALWAALAGLLAGAAAGSSLLTAPVGPVLFLWILVANRCGSRWIKAVAFAVAGVVPFAPLLRLLAESPRQVLFDVLQYHMFYRQVEWSGALAHNLEIALAWVDCGQALALLLLAAGGLWWVWKSDWERPKKAEMYLCGALAVVECVHVLTARPTFAQYFLFTVPFLAVPASAGLCAFGERLTRSGRARWVVAAACCLMVLGCGKRLWIDRDDFSWVDQEAIAAKVDQVTPAGAAIYADEQVYFLTRRTPPPGMEYGDSHKLRLPAGQSVRLHVVEQPELDKMIKSKAFRTAQICEDDEIKRLGVADLYAHKAEVSDCSIFWGPK